MNSIELTKAEAKIFRNGSGLEGFARAQKMKQRAQAQAQQSGQSCSLTFNGEVLYVAQPN